MLTRRGLPQPPDRIDTDAVRQHLDILAIASSLTKLRRSGTCFRGSCPCCSPGLGKDNFLVDPTWGKRPPHFHCFQCGVDGDAVTLAYFQRVGRTQIPDDQFPQIVRSIAAAYGIALPERPRARDQSPEAVRRTAVREAWEAAHAWCVTQFNERRAIKPAADSARNGSPVLDRPLPIGYFAADLRDHLIALGTAADTRVDAGLSDQDLAQLHEGLVVLRSVAGRPVGLSQQQDTGGASHWVHLGLAGARVDPALLGSPPHGRETDRLLIFVPDVVCALRLYGALRHLQRGDGDESRRAITYGIVIAPPDDPLDARSVRAITRRAVVLLHGSATSCATTTQHGTALLELGLTVRVADSPPLSVDGRIHRSDVLAAMAGWDAGSDLFTWLWTSRIADLPAGCDRIAVARHWLGEEVTPLLKRCADPTTMRLFAHRAARVCGLATDPHASAPTVLAPDGLSAPAHAV